MSQNAPKRAWRTTRKRTAISFGLIFTFLAVWAQETALPFVHDTIQRLEYVAYDIRMNAFPLRPIPQQDNVVIVSVDEKSLQEIGRWPWPRSKIAQLVEQLFEYQAAIIGFDMMFPEPELNIADRIKTAWPRNKRSPQVTQALRALTRHFDHDTQLANSISLGDTVLGYTFHADGENSVNPTPDAIAKLGEDLPQETTGIVFFPYYSAAIEKLQSAALSNAFLTTLPDHDGILRRSPMLIRHQDQIYASLSLEIARQFLLIEDTHIKTIEIGDDTVPELIAMDNFSIPTDASGNTVIPFRGPSPQFTYISATDVINKHADPEQLDGKIVLIGYNALGLTDTHATPVQNIYPGVEVHATLISSILAQDFVMDPPWASGANLSFLLIAGILLSLILPFLGAVKITATALLALTLFTAFNLWAWQQGMILNLALPLVLISLLALLNLIEGFFFASKQRREIKALFGQYVPPELVDRMLAQSDPADMASESRDMTVLFADIRNFTTLSESLSPAELKTWLNMLFDKLTEVIFKHQGTIDKYVGDMIMAFWNAPVDDKHHPMHALEAAMAMIQAVNDLNPHYRSKGLPEVKIGIGINTGVMNVGDMGSIYRRAYTVIGDSVNLASRLEGLCKYYGVDIVVSHYLRERTSAVAFRQLDRVKVKGKSEAIEVFEPLGLITDISDELNAEVTQYHEALHHYYKQEWALAEAAFTDLAHASPSTRLYSLYLERITSIRHQPFDPLWDGVYERREK